MVPSRSAKIALLLWGGFSLCCQAAMPSFLESDPASVVAWSAVQVSHAWGLPRRAIVTLKDGFSVAESVSAAERLRLAVGEETVQTMGLSNVNMAVLDFPFDSSFTEIRNTIDKVLSLHFVESVEEDSVVSIPPAEELKGLVKHEKARKVTQGTFPDDPLWPLLWGMRNIRATEAWRNVTGAEPTHALSRPIVTVIDTGVDYTHPDLVGNMWTNEAEANGEPGVDDDGNGFVDDIHGWNAISNTGDPFDDHWHGTHCAGTIGAVGNNTLGVVGVSWGPLIQACKFLDRSGRGLASGALVCLDYAIATGSKITNNSWGNFYYSYALRNAIASSVAKGQLFVAAAGNSGLNTDEVPFYPSGYDLPNIISVAALTEENRLAPFSNFGSSSVHIAAPGSDVTSTFPGGSYATASGTSFAAPHVSGAAALAMVLTEQQEYPSVMEMLKKSVRDFEANDAVMWGGRLDLASLTEKFGTQNVVEGIGSAVDSSSAELRVVLAPSTATCLQSCAMSGLACDDVTASLINADLDFCFTLLDISLTAATYWSRGSSSPRPSLHPFGCYVSHFGTTHIVHLNLNNFGTPSEVGCDAAPAEIVNSFRPCPCLAL